jgi:hypothetical protein
VAHAKATQSLARGPGPRVILLGRQPPSAAKANRRVRSTPPPAVVRLCTSAKTNSLVSVSGAQAHEHPPWVLVPGCAEVEPPLALVPCLLGAATEDREGEFSKPTTVVSRHPVHGPVKPLSAKTTSQSATGTGASVDVTDGRLTARSCRVNAARAEEAPRSLVMPI